MSKGMFVGVDKASGLSKSYLVQHVIERGVATGIHPISQGIYPVFAQYLRRVRIMPNDIKRNKYSIITIMMKTIAGDLRVKYPDLYVEAHPRPGANHSRLLVRRVKTDEKIIIDLRPGVVNSLPTVFQQFGPSTDPRTTNQYTAFPDFYRKNRVSKKDAPNSFTFALDDPDGTISFEKWIDEHVTNWFYVNSSSAAKLADNHDRSASSRCGGVSNSGDSDS